MDFDIVRKDVTGSTNVDVWELAKSGAAAGTTVWALRQEAGRGKWERAWASPEGGLYFSVLLRPSLPECEWPGLSVACARAIARTERAEAGVTEADVWVKEPNDVICASGKLCGILLEAKDGCVVAGCGLNVFPPVGGTQTDGRNVPAYLCELNPASRVASLAATPGEEGSRVRRAYLAELLDKMLAAIAEEVGALERR